MRLHILNEPPPCYDAVIARFPFATRAGTYFTYGRAVFIPKLGREGLSLAPALIAHETVHANRQGNDPAGWWARYLVDRAFRLAEELPAHIAEYAHWKDKKPGLRRIMLRAIASRLASPLYDLGITVHEAKQLITGKDDPDA